MAEPNSLPSDIEMPLPRFKQLIKELQNNLTVEYAEVKKTLGFNLFHKAPPAIIELEQLLDDLEAAISLFEAELQHFSPPTYQAPSSLLDKKAELLQASTELERTFRDQEVLRKQRITTLESQLEQLRNDVTNAHTKHDVEITRQRAERERKDDENKAKQTSTQRQMEEEKATCVGTVFPCCDAKLRKLHRTLAMLEEEAVTLSAEPTLPDTTPDIDDLNFKIQAAEEELAQARLDNKGEDDAGRNFRAKQYELSKILAHLSISTEVVNNIVTNRIMFLALRIYEKLLLVESATHKAAGSVNYSTTAPFTEAATSKTPPHNSFSLFLEILTKAIENLLLRLKKFFCPHSRDFNGKYFLAAYSQLPNEKQTALLASPEVPLDFIPNINGPLLTLNQQYVQGIAPIDEPVPHYAPSDKAAMRITAG